MNPKSFVLGIVFSLFLFSLYSFTDFTHSEVKKDHLENTKAVVPIDQATAQAYRNNYTSARPGGLEAINVSVEQWQAINQVVAGRNNNLNNISGFRMYFGATSTNPDAPIVSIAYTLNSNLEENPPGQTLSMADGFNRAYSQQCPPFCD
jgi:hypothetical protein